MGLGNDTTARRPHDALFKAAFESPEQAAGLFACVLPPEIVAEVDWSSLRSEPGSFIDADLADRHSDLLFSASLRGAARRLLLYLLLEHQSERDPDMPLRMLGYEVRIWEAYRARHPRGVRPLILPVVISHAPGGWTEPHDFWALFDGVEALSNHQLAMSVPRFRLIIEDLAHRSNDDIKAWSLGVFQRLALWLLRDARDGRALLPNVTAWADALEAAHAEALRAGHGLRAFAQLMHYIWYVAGGVGFDAFRAKILEHVPASEEVVMTIAEELIGKGRAQGREEGRAQGREEGRAEGRVEGGAGALRLQLRERFGALDPDSDARIAAASPDELERYLRRIIHASTIADVFAP